MDHVWAIVMAGGAGTRFWPASRKHHPKQLLDLTGSGKALITATVDRLRPLIPPERVIVVTGEAIADRVAVCLPDVPTENILTEPVGRNTAPCIGWAAVHIRHRDPEAILAVLPSDHLIPDVAAFQAKIRLAAQQAQQERVVTMGIVPTAPKTDFGYIETGDPVGPGVLSVRRFVEKPDIETACQYVNSGNYVWNSGMFFFSARRILTEIRTHLPDLEDCLNELATALCEGHEADVRRSVFARMPAVSIDYGVMEHLTDLVCLPVDFGWSDLGSWSAAAELMESDDNGNTRCEQGVFVQSRNCIVRVNSEKTVALVGLENMIVVDTDDALLICHRDADQEVRQVVEILKHRERDDLL